MEPIDVCGVLVADRLLDYVDGEGSHRWPGSQSQPTPLMTPGAHGIEPWSARLDDSSLPQSPQHMVAQALETSVREDGSDSDTDVRRQNQDQLEPRCSQPGEQRCIQRNQPQLDPPEIGHDPSQPRLGERI